MGFVLCYAESSLVDVAAVSESGRAKAGNPILFEIRMEIGAPLLERDPLKDWWRIGYLCLGGKHTRLEVVLTSFEQIYFFGAIESFELELRYPTSCSQHQSII